MRPKSNTIRKFRTESNDPKRSPQRKQRDQQRKVIRANKKGGR